MKTTWPRRLCFPPGLACGHSGSHRSEDVRKLEFDIGTAPQTFFGYSPSVHCSCCQPVQPPLLIYWLIYYYPTSTSPNMSLLPSICSGCKYNKNTVISVQMKNVIQNCCFLLLTPTITPWGRMTNAWLNGYAKFNFILITNNNLTNLRVCFLTWELLRY